MNQGCGAAVVSDAQQGSGLSGSGKAGLHDAVFHHHVAGAAGIDYVGKGFVVDVGPKGHGFAHLQRVNGVAPVVIRFGRGEDKFSFADGGRAVDGGIHRGDGELLVLTNAQRLAVHRGQPHHDALARAVGLS